MKRGKARMLPAHKSNQETQRSENPATSAQACLTVGRVEGTGFYLSAD